MCGIIGICSLDGTGTVDKASLKRMADMISYRGPDQEGCFTDKGIGLYHKRLSIIDLSSKGKQPMLNAEGDVVIVFNGEIYNYQELRKELEQKYAFGSDSDTEVILHGYEEYGPEIVQRLHGMFAFAIWDYRNSREKKLFMARDRVGKKPLFYFMDKDNFMFASELKALLQEESVKRRISREAISHYLSYGFIPAPLSIFEDVKKLEPGHYLTLTVRKNGKTRNERKKKVIKDRSGNLRTDRLQIVRYWDLRFIPASMNEQGCCSEILRLLENGVKKRMIADVPLGAFLSGGIDSSAVVALMAKNSQEPVKTFSIGFEEKKFNELEHASLIATRFRTEHHEMIVAPEALKILPEIVWLYNEPFADSSAIPSWYVSRETRKHVTVALNGDGGDESFAGYGRFFMDKYVDRYNSLPQIARNIIGKTAGNTPAILRKTLLFRRLRELDSLSGLPKDERFIALSSIMGGREKEELCKKDSGILDHDSRKIYAEALQKMDPKITDDQLSRNLYAGMKVYLPNDLLVKMDIASMAHSLEARSPFLDHMLMEFAATIPSSLKMKDNERKYILKKALAKVLPHEILQKKKQGFSVPMNSWMKGELGERASSVLLDKRAISRGYFNESEVREMIDAHRAGKRENGHRIWSLLMLELWHRTYVEDDGKRALSEI
ncbi:MAG TPA: asparagine synthase (glutamine-hydrolyzing) [Candidatus Nanoarchaeia archaeon]|nr:asparagine synthase (glutamine-hydrolyzing) [Candidatus Nanoarchaeia archaeon]